MHEARPQGDKGVFVNAWWYGLGLWYNDGLYVEAMDSWLQAVDRLYQFDSNVDDDWAALHDFDSETFHARMNRPQRSSQEVMSSFETSLARLLLFLAGCSLDAGKPRAARRLLTYGLILLCEGKNNKAHDLLVDNMLMEYVASFHEELGSDHDSSSSSVAPHIAAYELLHRIIDSSCLPLQRTSPYYRAPCLVSHCTPGLAVPSKQPGWCRALEDHCDIIQEELAALLEGQSWPRVGGATHREGAGSHDGSVVSKGSWNEIVLFGSTGGRPELAPRTSALIAEHCQDDVLSLVNAGAGEVILSLLQPRTRIEPHTALHNLRLTAHLGLIVPVADDDDRDASCYLQVAGQILTWKEGTMLVFDDAYEHSVVNDTDGIRVVLLLRFWHPSIQPEHREEARDCVLESKGNDQLRRFNPPLPHGSQLSRGMEQDSCGRCGESGYTSIRLTRSAFHCMCGSPIDP